MLNYIRAEFYKVFHRKYTWITLIIVVALEALWVSAFVFTNAHGNDYSFYNTACILVVMLGVGFAATLMTGDMVFANQYRHTTLKNEVSFGLSRGRIYWGKLIVQTVLSILFCVVMVGFYLGLCWLTMYHDPELDVIGLRIVGYCLAVAFPLWVGVQALVCAMYFLINSELGAVLVSLGIFMVLPNALRFAIPLSMGSDGSTLGNILLNIYEHMPLIMANSAYTVVGDWAYCGKAWIVGAIWFIVFTALGLLVFRKKEIK